MDIRVFGGELYLAVAIVPSGNDSGWRVTLRKLSELAAVGPKSTTGCNTRQQGAAESSARQGTSSSQTQVMTGEAITSLSHERQRTSSPPTPIDTPQRGSTGITSNGGTQQSVTDSLPTPVIALAAGAPFGTAVTSLKRPITALDSNAIKRKRTAESQFASEWVIQDSVCQRGAGQCKSCRELALSITDPSANVIKENCRFIDFRSTKPGRGSEGTEEVRFDSTPTSDSCRAYEYYPWDPQRSVDHQEEVKVRSTAQSVSKTF